MNQPDRAEQEQERRRLFSGECRCPKKFAKPTICPEHGLQSKPVTNPIKPRGER
jgi:hypothetical protein